MQYMEAFLGRVEHDLVGCAPAVHRTLALEKLALNFRIRYHGIKRLEAIKIICKDPLSETIVGHCALGATAETLDGASTNVL